MVSMRAYRSDPHFAPLFDGVPVFCWPILWWSLNHLFRYCKRHNIPDVLYAVTPWGFIRVVHFGAPPNTAAYQPIPRTFRPLTDECWSSDLPANLNGLSPLDEAITLSDGLVLRSLWRSGKGALPSIPNTS